MVGHTKGPWTFGHADGDIYNTSTYSSVAIVLMKDGWQANARLIAAAPDLAEAAEAAAEAILAVADEIPEFVHSARVGSLRVAAKQLRAALAKATTP